MAKTVQEYLESLQAKPSSTLATPMGTVDISDRISRKLGHVIVDSMPSTPVTISSLPLPLGAATSDLQTYGFYTIGGVSFLTDALAIQGISGMTPLDIRGVGDAPIKTYTIKNSTATYSPLLFKNLGVNTTLNVKGSPGATNVFSLSCYRIISSGSGIVRSVQLHNTATTPSAGAVPALSFYVPELSQVVIGTDFFSNEGINFSSGVAFAWSTSMTTYVAATANEHATFITYK